MARCKPWTDKEERKLRRQYKWGWADDVIASGLHGRTAWAVAVKRSRLGLVKQRRTKARRAGLPWTPAEVAKLAKALGRSEESVRHKGRELMADA